MQKHIILIVCYIAAGLIGYGQNPMTKEYSYDASGNRIQHHIISFRNHLLQNSSDEEKATDASSEPCYTGQIGSLQLNIYPNPTLGQINVQVVNSVEAISGIIRVYTPRGQLLRTLPVDAPNCTIDLSAEPAGSYLVKVQLNRFEQEWKIIKE